MTLRARPVAKRPGRAGWDAGDRRTTLINAGFIGAIVVSAIILIGYAGWTWYDSHFGTAATVDGTVITRDDVRTRFAIEKFRIDYTEARVNKLFQDGRISKSVQAQQLSFLSQRRSSLDAITLEKLIDITLQAKLATEAGITVTDGDVDEQLQTEATFDEQRHTWMIEVEPIVDPATGQVGAAQKADAKAKADAALAQLQAGKSWDDVAKTVSTASTAPQAGDVSWLPKDSGYDTKFMDAVFAAEKDKPTAVIEGLDGIFRIGRYTETAPATVDQAFSAKLDNAGIKLADYRAAVRADVSRTKLSDSVVADLSKPSLQRHVLQIYLKSTTPTPDGVKVRHILFAPKNDASGAAKLPETDPAWAAAKAEAEAAYEALLKDPSKFDEMARTMSDDQSAKETGGQLPSDGTFYDPPSQLDEAFKTQIFKEGLKPGDLIPPFRSTFGWHVVQFMRPYGDGNQAWLEEIKKQADAGTDFAQLARDQSDHDADHRTSDLGWVAKGQLGEARDGAIFGATIGGTTTVVDIASDGDYLFKVLAEEMRDADPQQIAVFKDTGFTDWYAVKKAAAKIDRNTGSAGTG
jgi:parvulin-like peptidyl-prolyl isomerase